MSRQNDHQIQVTEERGTAMSYLHLVYNLHHLMETLNCGQVVSLKYAEGLECRVYSPDVLLDESLS